jgi:hypothetical protein
MSSSGHRVILGDVEIHDDNVKKSFVAFNPSNTDTDDEYLLVIELKAQEGRSVSNFTLNPVEIEEALKLIKDSKMAKLIGISDDY